VKHWETIHDNLSKAGWSWGCVSAIDSNGRTIFCASLRSANCCWFGLGLASVWPLGRAGPLRLHGLAPTQLRHNLIGTIGCSGSDKTVQNLTDCADRNRAGQTLRKDFTGSREFVCAGISLVNSPIESAKACIGRKGIGKRLVMAQIMLN
jgi:hypothetical protein